MKSPFVYVASVSLLFLVQPAALAKSKDPPPNDVQLFKSKSKRIVVRFAGEAAKFYHYQFLKNYQFKVKGIVDGKDMACLMTNETPKSLNRSCAFYLDRNGRISNVFTIQPKSTEDTIAQLTLLSTPEINRNLGPLTEGADYFKRANSSRLLSSQTQNQINRENYLEFTGEAAELLFNFIKSGYAIKTPATSELFKNRSVKAIEVAKNQISCRANLESSKPRSKIGYVCEIKFTRNGEAIAMTEKPSIRTVYYSPDELRLSKTLETKVSLQKATAPLVAQKMRCPTCFSSLKVSDIVNR